MARIYKRSDRIVVKIDDVVVKLAPLTIDQKVEIQQLMLDGTNNRDLKQMTKAISLAIQYSVKALDGVVDADNRPYELKFENDRLTDDCLDDLLNLEITSKLSLVCSQMANGVPKDFGDDPKLKGVEVLNPQPEQAEKNA